MLASGRASMTGAVPASGVATVAAGGAGGAPDGAASTSTWPTLITFGFAMPFQAASSR